MRFELIDRVEERDADRIVAVKNVSAAEEYLGDHFPGFAVLPGVMMLEAMVQAARHLLAGREEPGPWVLAEVRNLRYGNMVRPGQQLRVEVAIKKAEAGRFAFQGSGQVGSESAVQGRFVLRRLQSGA
ncbi:MAG: polyketide synthase dehydratase domain-containing protein [Phycisphaerae bacterium]|nr:polyketide synthase dehydratase domain-containing protein [Phycisphaerae bacterium]